MLKCSPAILESAPFLGVGTQNAGTRDQRVESGCHSHKCDSNQAHCMKSTSTSLNIHEYSIKSMRAPWHPSKVCAVSRPVWMTLKKHGQGRPSVTASRGRLVDSLCMQQSCFNDLKCLKSLQHATTPYNAPNIFTVDETRPNHQTMSSKFST